MQPGEHRAMRIHRDLLAGVALFVFAALYLAGSLALPEATEPTEPGPAFFPRLIGAALIGLAIVIVVSGLRDSGRGGLSPERASRHEVARTIALVALTLSYVLAFEPFGALPSTLVYSFLATLLFRPARGWHWLLVPLLSVVVVYALFARGLGLILPGME